MPDLWDAAGQTNQRRAPGCPQVCYLECKLAPTRIAQVGIRTVAVSYAALSQSVTTVGYVAFDERRLATIVSKVPGKTRVEKLYANYTGKDVESGEALAELYSPELDQAFQELLTAARRANDGAGQFQTAEARTLFGDRKELVRLASEKLRRWGIRQEQIDEVLRTGKANASVAVLSPIGGHLVKKNVVEGQEVPESFPMFEVASLHTVWVQAQVYEHQLALIHEGQAVRASVDAFPGQLFPGKVEFVQPHLDPSTRTVEVRFSLDNPGHKLRPGMFATVTLEAPVSEMPAFRPAGCGPAGARSDPAIEPDRREPRGLPRDQGQAGLDGTAAGHRRRRREGLDLLHGLSAETEGRPREVPGPRGSSRPR